MYRVFMNAEPNHEDASIVREILAEVCKVNEATKGADFGALLEMVRNEGKREVYLKLVDAIGAGGKLVAGSDMTDIVDSGGLDDD